MIDKISIKIDGVEYCSVSDIKSGDCSSCTFGCDIDGCIAPIILAGVCCDESIHWEKVVKPTEQKRQYTVVIDRVKYDSVDATSDGLTCKQCDFYCQQCTFPQHHTMRYTCGIHDIVWRKSDMKHNTKTGHKHAKLMIEYANDCLANHEAFRNWQVLVDSNDWVDLCNHPLWHEADEYRRKPTVMIGGVEVPKPETTAPQVGTKYWLASPTQHTVWYWNNDNYDKDMLNAGILHLTKEGADKHRKALFDYNKKCCGIVL